MVLRKLKTDLADAITDAVAAPGDPAVRAEMILQIVEEISASVAWRHGSRPIAAERRSLDAVVAAATEHHRRMSVGRPLLSSPDPEPVGRAG